MGRAHRDAKTLHQMLAFIRAQPSIIERMLRHLETSSFVDLLVRIIQLDEQPGGEGVLDWLSSENLIGRLVDLMSPAHPPDIHVIVSELLKGIISMSIPLPGSGISDIQSVAFSNQLPRQLCDRETSMKLAGYILDDFQPPRSASGSVEGTTDAPSSPIETLPNVKSCSSSITHSIDILTELIRKNNSDYFEPYLFHTLRNRLIQVQQQLQSSPDDNRQSLEEAMDEMTARMGVVPLGNILEALVDQLHVLQKYLNKPRTLTGPIRSTLGDIIPFTAERFRICELLGELLHCSNMSLLNRSAEFNRLYDAQGKLQGGLHALEDLANVISAANGADRPGDPSGSDKDEVEPALELPVASSHTAVSGMNSDDDDMSDDHASSDEDVMEEVAMSEDLTHSGTFSTPPGTPPTLTLSPAIMTSELSTDVSPKPRKISRRKNSSSSESSAKRQRSTSSTSPQTFRSSMHLANSVQILSVSAGQRLKQKFLDLSVLSTLLDLFFEFPWANFLHGSVYDIIHQVLTGPPEMALNKELTVSLFRDSRLLARLLDGQKQNDSESLKPKGVRLGFMGHLTLITEEVVTALERFPPELRAEIDAHIPKPDWDDYVLGKHQKTRERNNRLLGGGKPVISQDPLREARWKVDEEEEVAKDATRSSGSSGEGSFTRATSSKPSPRQTADFGPPDAADSDPGENTAPQFARYLAQEINTADQFGSTSSDSDDEDEDDGGWLTQSTFTLQAPPLSARHDSQKTSNGFADAFNPASKAPLADDPFASDEDDFGQFSEASTSSSGSDPFKFSSSFTAEDLEDATFEGFGDFGDFQRPSDDGASTPTGSWTFEDSFSPADKDQKVRSPAQKTSAQLPMPAAVSLPENHK